MKMLHFTAFHFIFLQQKLVRGILDGNFTGENIDSAISMIRMFSRRRTNRVPLGLGMRLESVEMLNSALMRQRSKSIRIFRSTRSRSRREVGYLTV